MLVLHPSPFIQPRLNGSSICQTSSGCLLHLSSHAHCSVHSLMHFPRDHLPALLLAGSRRDWPGLHRVGLRPVQASAVSNAVDTIRRSPFSPTFSGIPYSPKAVIVKTTSRWAGRVSVVRVPETVQQQRTFLLSSPAASCSSSGLVLFGLNAVSSVAAAASSDPLLLYSFDSGFRSSLPWASLRARRVGVGL